MRTSFPFVGNCSNTKFGIELGPVAFLALREKCYCLFLFLLQGLLEIKLSFDFVNNLKISFLMLVFFCLHFLQ